ncbi:LLM class flavin-dependent oxidoreductase [Nocardia panacis]|uniref:LLM class flavin-dependent oxidoreductase n=1 Tax=Nocardia panacis TaxID=2340916 RepID=A0A3A4KAE4_9NOCA|nr:LLM class flavin-dependent oxidoreductase [Nocardia panacis]RJO69116.1 LLM class flavin-dependent oxidoreductase [Nocardia panacis]
MPSSAPFLAVELAGAGAHPAAWRRADSRAEAVFTGDYWADAVRAAENAGIDAVFLPDAFGPQPGGPGVVRGRLDAVAVAARAAAGSTGIGLLPQAPVTHTEPFHLAKAIQSLDFATKGRAGWEVTVSETAAEAKSFGRKNVQNAESLWHEADEAIEVATRLWDSWDDDAEIRDLPTGRFIDRDRLHYIDFTGDNFSVKGPSITPRSPQGQSILTVRADHPAAAAIAVRRADLIRIAAPDLDAARTRRDGLRAAIADAGRDPDTVRVLLDLDIHLADTPETAVAEFDRLEDFSPTPIRLRHLGTAAGLAEFVDTAVDSRAADGLTLRPLALAAALRRLPELGRNPLSATTLRTRLGLPRPEGRYATARQGIH